MFGFDGEFAHPEIDRELDDPGVRDRVQSLIDAEKDSLPPADPLPAFPPLSEPPNVSLSREAHFEDLGRQYSNLSRLLWDGGQLWNAERLALEHAVQSAEKRKAILESQIADLSEQRRISQENARQKLERLQGTERDVRHSISAIQAAIGLMRESPD
jgi:hypothetical protein